MDFRKLVTNAAKSLISKVKKKSSFTGLLHSGVPINSNKWAGGDFLKALDISLYLNRAIQKRAESVGGIEFILRDKNDEKIEDDEKLKLLYKPNSIFTAREFWSLYQKYLDCLGEAYIYLHSDSEIFSEDRVTELHLLIPTHVRKELDDNGRIVKYKYSVKGGTRVYDPEQIIYIHNPDPKSPLRGQSILKAGINAIQTESEISTYHSRILENGGKVEGVFKFKGSGLTEEQLKQIKERYQKEYGQAKKAGLPMFLGGDAEYINTGLSPQELSYLEAKRTTLEDICILTGVPKTLLASFDGVKFDNAEASRTVFLRETVKPLLKKLTTALNEKLFNEDRVLDFIDPTPENIEIKLKNIESGIKNHYMTINEAREMQKLDPVDGGDKIMIPFNLMELGSESDEVSESDQSKQVKKKDTKEMEHPLRDPIIRRLYWNIQIKRMNKREKGFKRDVNSYFNDQRDRLIESLQPNKTWQFRKQNLLGEVFNIVPEVEIGKEMFVPVIRDLLKQSGSDAVDLVGGDDFNITTDMVSWIDQKSEVFLQSINETTFETLKKEFEESFAQEEGREELIKRIENTYGDIKQNRAALIARTEVHNATQFGTLKGYEQAGMNLKIWVAVMDSRTRSSHANLDGEEVPINAAFSNGLMYPGDKGGSAEETINCRCVI